MRRYEEKITRYVRRIANVSRETAEDLVQEIFLKAYQNINDFDESLKFSSWLYRIAHNHVISHWRRHKNESQVLSWDADDNFKNMFESDDDPVKETDDKMTARRISQAMSLIRPEYKEVLLLRYMEYKDYSEIGDILKKPVGTIGTMILRAKKELKKVLEKEKHFYEQTETTNDKNKSVSVKNYDLVEQSSSANTPIKN